MFDVTSYGNGFGVVLVPFVVGVVIRAILSMLSAGSVRTPFMIVFLLLFVPALSSAGQFTSRVESVHLDGTVLYLVGDSITCNSSNDDFKQLLISSFFKNQEITVSYNDADYHVESVSVSTVGNLDSKNISLFLGGISCAAFALGCSLKIM